MEYLLAHSALFASSLILLSCLFIAWLLNKKLKFFRSFNPFPLFHPILPHQETGLHRIPTKIKTGLIIDEFLAFDPVQNLFILHGHLWFIFNPSLITLSSLQNFSFQRGSLLEKSEPETKLLATSEMFAKFKIRLQFSSEVNFRNFPLDDQRLYVVMESNEFSSNEVIFIATGGALQMKNNLSISGWRFIKYYVHYGYQTIHLSSDFSKTTLSKPCVVFALDFAKMGIRKTLNVLVPLIAIFYVGYFSIIFIPFETAGIVNTVLASGTITALLAYRFVLESMTPSVSYFTFSDSIYTISLLLSFVVLLINIFSIFEEKQTSILLEIKFYSLILLPTILTLWMYILYRKMIGKNEDA